MFTHSDALGDHICCTTPQPAENRDPKVHLPVFSPSSSFSIHTRCLAGAEARLTFSAWYAEAARLNTTRDLRMRQKTLDLDARPESVSPKKHRPTWPEQDAPASCRFGMNNCHDNVSTVIYIILLSNISQTSQSTLHPTTAQLVTLQAKCF